MRNSAHEEHKNKNDTSNNRGNWNYIKITQTIPEQHNGKQQQETTKKKKSILGTAQILRKLLL